MNRIYISGPIAGRPDGNREAFARAADTLGQCFPQVVNPREFMSNVGKSWSECLHYDLGQMLTCDSIALLPGWEQSKGACLEAFVANNLGMTIYDAETVERVVLPAKFLIERFVLWTQERATVEADLGEESIAEEAMRLVNGARQGDYGHPFDDFSKTAKIWEAILGTEVTPEQVALCMIGVKISREVHKPKRDNGVDGIGYWMTLDMVKAERKRRDALKPDPDLEDLPF